MLGLLVYILEVKKELLVGFSLSVLYITYYLVEAVKKPRLVSRDGEFRRFLEREVPLLSEPYWPTPWCIESRLQTVVGSVLRSSLLPSVRCHREVLSLADGGQLALDWIEPGPESCGKAPAVLVLMPGLTGSADADYVRSLAAAARQLALPCVVFNNRGLGGMEITTPRLYCAVSHGDLAEALQAVRARCGEAVIFAAGVSLGGLILGQYLAERGEQALVAAALAVSSPLDVVRGAKCMESAPLNAPLSYHMARQLRQTVRAHAALQAVTCDWAAVEAARSVRQFDAAFTAQHFGFSSVDEYYRAATLRDKLERIRVPLLCLCAADDPFQPLSVMPLREAEASDNVALAVTARGGHIGFMEGWWPARSSNDQYLARLTLQYFGAMLHRPDLLHRPKIAC